MMVDSTKALDAELLGAIARGWCAPENANKVMDPDLAFAIAREVTALAQPAGDADEAAMDAWHSAVDDAGELFGNAPDERFKNRASRVVTWIKANRPAPPVAAGDARDLHVYRPFADKVGGSDVGYVRLADHDRIAAELQHANDALTVNARRWLWGRNKATQQDWQRMAERCTTGLALDRYADAAIDAALTQEQPHG